MPLVFSPLNEETISIPPKSYHPRRAFLMRQLGGPPAVDLEMARIVEEEFAALSHPCIDADGNVGGGDYLERILGLIRSTGFTVAVFSEETRPTAFANIALELGFAAMCGKPLVIVKSKTASAPSDLKRTDWIDYDPAAEADFRRKLRQAIEAIERVAEFEFALLEAALSAPNIDCAVAFERAIKGWLLSGDPRFVAAARKVLARVRKAAAAAVGVSDLNRVASEITAFVQMAKAAR